MTWTYVGNPLASDVSLVHFRLGDVDASNPLASDEECAQALVDARGNSYLAAAILAEAKALTLLMRPTRETRGDLTIEYRQQAEAFKLLADTLRRNANIANGGVYAGGIERGDKDANARDHSLVRPFATTHLHEFQPYSVEAEEREP